MASVYFISGGTGFVGQELLRHLALGSAEKVYCLIRRKRGQDPERRLRRVLRKAGVEDSERFIAVQGDVTAPDLGMDEALREQFASEVELVIHSAADVRFSQPLDEIRAINVQGTRRMIEFSQLCQNRGTRFSALAYVSTAFVAGRRTGVVDADTLEHSHDFKNTYEQSKYEAESLIRQVWSDTPVVVFRPSIVLGPVEERTRKRRDLIYPLIVMFAQWPLPVIGQDDTVRVDFVPVDYVAKSILYLAGRSENHRRTFHLAAGPGEDLSMTDCTQIVATAMQRKVAIIPNRAWEKFLVPIFRRLYPEMADEGRDITEYFGPYLDEENTRFSMAATELALTGSGIKKPPLAEVLHASVRRTLELGGVEGADQSPHAATALLDRRRLVGALGRALGRARSNLRTDLGKMYARTRIFRKHDL